MLTIFSCQTLCCKEHAWNSTRRSAHTHVTLLISVSSLSRVLTLASCFDNKSPFKLTVLTTQDDLHVPITVLSALTSPFLSYFLSSIDLILLTRTTLPIQKPLPRDSRTLTSLSSFSLSLYMLTSTIHSPLPAPPRSLLYKTRLADMYIRWSSRSSRSIVPSIVLAQLSSSLFPSFSLACLLDLAIVRWNRCPHDLGRLPPSLSWFTPQSWTTFTLAAPILDTLRADLQNLTSVTPPLSLQLVSILTCRASEALQPFALHAAAVPCHVE